MWSDVRLLTHLSESDVEQAALEWLEGLGWRRVLALTSQRDALLSVPVSGEVKV